MQDGRLDNGTFKRWGETLVGGATGTNSGSTYTVDLTTGNVFFLILNANCAFTFSNPTGSGTECSFTVILHQDSTGGRTVAWPFVVKWPGGVVPVLTSAANGIDILAFSTYDGGANWYGFPMAQRMLLASGLTRFGYFMGGSSGSPSVSVSTIYRIDYSNDTATVVARGSLSSALGVGVGTGTSAFGYYTNGSTTSAFERMDYSNDTATTVTRSNLTGNAGGGRTAATSPAFAYVGGGTKVGGVYFSTVDRLDYSSDNTATVVKGPLSAARQNFAAAGTSSFGYFAGGATTSVTNRIDRIDYSNDTATAVAKGPLSASKFGLLGASSSTFGYFGGGTTPAPAVLSTVDRVDYSNDTATAVAKGPLTITRDRHSATGNSSFAYFAGGESPAQVSSIDRVDYSNDTATALAKGPFPSTLEGSGGTFHGGF